jgi:hypothetical protein
MDKLKLCFICWSFYFFGLDKNPIQRIFDYYAV